MIKNQDYGCIIEWCDCISDILEKQSIFKTPQYCEQCLHCIQILGKGKYELAIHIKICFIKIGVVFSEISAKVEDIQTAISLAIFMQVCLVGSLKTFSVTMRATSIFSLIFCIHVLIGKYALSPQYHQKESPLSILFYFLAIYNIFIFRSASQTLKTALVPKIF